VLGFEEGVGVVVEFLFELLVLFEGEGDLVFELMVLNGEFLGFVLGLAVE
jgi:hypothetical protein